MFTNKVYLSTAGVSFPYLQGILRPLLAVTVSEVLSPLRMALMILKQLLLVYFYPRTVSFSYVDHNMKQHVLQISKLKYKKIVVAFIFSFFLVLFGNKAYL